MVGNVVYSGGEMQAKQETVERTVTLGDFYTQPITLQDFMGETHNAQAKRRKAPVRDGHVVVQKVARMMKAGLPCEGHPGSQGWHINRACEQAGTITLSALVAEVSERVGKAVSKSRVRDHIKVCELGNHARLDGDVVTWLAGVSAAEQFDSNS